MAPAYSGQRVAFVQVVDPDPGPGGPVWSGSGPDMYRADWSPSRRRRRHRRARRSGRTASILIAVSAAVGGVVAVNLPQRTAVVPISTEAVAEPRVSTPAAARGRPRVTAKPAASATVRKAVPEVARVPEPVAGLSRLQMNNAAVIVQVAQELNLPRRAMLVAMITGLQESSLRNLANPTVPGSLDRPNEGDGSNFDSLGIFQQRPSQGWGTVAQLMTPRYATKAFYRKLLTITDWEQKSIGDAAQAVQRSAVPDAYADHEERAAKVVDALL